MKLNDTIDSDNEIIEKIKLTINTIFDLAEKIKCREEDIFDKVEPNVIIKLIREEKLSPWLLFCSAKFKSFYYSLSNEYRKEINFIVDPETWLNKFKANEYMIVSAKEFANKIGI